MFFLHRNDPERDEVDVKMIKTAFQCADLPKEQSERPRASWPSMSRLGFDGRSGRSDRGPARGGGQQELSGDDAGGVTRLHWDQCNGAVAANTCRHSHKHTSATRRNSEWVLFFTLFSVEPSNYALNRNETIFSTRLKDIQQFFE